MKLQQRRLFYAGATLLFVLLAPILILYAQGYRFDFPAMRFLRTGGLVMVSEPKRAHVTLDGKALNKTTPVTLLNVVPGEYDVTLTKAGYQPWRSRVRVRSHVSTKIEALLMPTVLSLTALPVTNVVTLAASDDGAKIAVLTSSGNGGRINIYDSRRRVFQDLAVFDGNVVSSRLAWSANDRFLAVRTSVGQVVVLHGTTGQLEPLPASPQLSIDRMVWDPQNDNFLYVVADETLWKIDLFSHRASVLTSPGIVDAAVYDGSLWIVRRGREESTIEEVDRESPNARQRVIDTNWPIERLLFIGSNRLLVEGQAAMALLDVDGAALSETQIDGRVAVSSRDPTGRYLLFTTSTEAWSADLATATFSLLGRFGALHGAAWRSPFPVALLLHEGTLTEVSVEAPVASSGSFGPFDEATAMVPLPSSAVAIITSKAVLLPDLEP